MPSRRHPLMINGLAAQIGLAGKLPLFDVLEFVGPRPDDDLTSLLRVEALGESLHLKPGVNLPAGPLLVVDDTYRTGWTMTVASSLLRGAGASEILPLVVHQLP